MDRWLAVSTVARRLNLKHHTLLWRIRAGHVHARRTPTGRYWIRASELARLTTIARDLQKTDPRPL